MIPDFKTYIKESVWGDIRRRAEGQAERKEDEIDNLEPDELAEYIKKKYDINVRDEFFGYDDETALLDVPIISWEKKIIPSKAKTRTISADTITYDYENNVIYIHQDSYPPLIDLLKSNFFLQEYDRIYYSIDQSAENSDLTNRFFMDIIDCVVNGLENDNDVTHLLKKKGINESVWGDIRRRAEGQVERQEDKVDVNSMSKDEFADYLRDRYEFDEPDCIMNPRNRTNIYVNIYHCDLGGPNNNTCTLDIGPYKMNMIGLPERLKVHISDVWTKKMKEIIDGQYKSYHDGGLRDLNDPIRIEPYDYREKESNEFFVGLLDYLIKNHDNVHKPLLKKR